MATTHTHAHEHDDNKDKDIPMEPMPTLSKLGDDESATGDEPASAGVSKVEAFNRVLYQSGMLLLPDPGDMTD